MKNYIYSVLNGTPESGNLGKFVTSFIASLIFLNVIFVILETVKSINADYGELFNLFETFSVIVFSIEYMLRFWSCTSDPKFKNSISGRLKHSVTYLSLIDLIAILPFFAPMLFAFDLRTLRLFRIFRFLRVVKFGRYSNSLKMFGDVLSRKKSDLLVCIFIVTILLIISSSFMYFLENEAQPESFSSIPASMWWGVATLTTVGYGDMYPITSLGKLIGAFISLLGIGMVALPAGILASGFADELNNKNM